MTLAAAGPRIRAPDGLGSSAHAQALRGCTRPPVTNEGGGAGPGNGKSDGHTRPGTGRQPKGAEGAAPAPDSSPGAPNPQPEEQVGSSHSAAGSSSAPPSWRDPRGRARLPAEQSKRAARAARSQSGGPRYQGACAQRHPTAGAGCGRSEANCAGALLSPCSKARKSALPFVVDAHPLFTSILQNPCQVGLLKVWGTL